MRGERPPVINSGSSSIKADVIDVPNQNRLQSFRVQRIGTQQCVCTVNGVKTVLPNANHAAAIEHILSTVTETLDAVGHRVVHGGERFVEPTRITPEVLSEIKGLTELAPLHIPANIAGIEACMTHYPKHFKSPYLILHFTVRCQDAPSITPSMEKRPQSTVYVDLAFMDCLTDGRQCRWRRKWMYRLKTCGLSYAIWAMEHRLVL